MTAFSKRLFCEDTGYVEFSFNEYYTGEEMKYRVKGDFHFYPYRFTMYEDNGVWKIANSNEIAEWIMKFEGQLSDAINEQKEH